MLSKAYEWLKVKMNRYGYRALLVGPMVVMVCEVPVSQNRFLMNFTEQVINVQLALAPFRFPETRWIAAGTALSLWLACRVTVNGAVTG